MKDGEASLEVVITIALTSFPQSSVNVYDLKFFSSH